MDRLTPPDRAQMFLDSKGIQRRSGVFNVADLYLWMREFEAQNLATIDLCIKRLEDVVSLLPPPPIIKENL
jgi:hypothetical protein